MSEIPQVVTAPKLPSKAVAEQQTEFKNGMLGEVKPQSEAIPKDLQLEQAKKVSSGLFSFINDRNPRAGIKTTSEDPYRLIADKPADKKGTTQPQQTGSPVKPVEPYSRSNLNPVDKAIMDTVDNGINVITGRRNTNQATQAPTPQPGNSPAQEQPVSSREKPSKPKSHSALPTDLPKRWESSDPNLILQPLERKPVRTDLVDSKGNIAKRKEDPAQRFQLQAGDFTLVDADGKMMPSGRSRREVSNNNPLSGQKNGQENRASQTGAEAKPLTPEEKRQNEIDSFVKTRMAEWHQINKKREFPSGVNDNDQTVYQQLADKAREHYKYEAKKFVFGQEYDRTHLHPTEEAKQKKEPAPTEEKVRNWIYDRNNEINRRLKEDEKGPEGTAVSAAPVAQVEGSTASVIKPESTATPSSKAPETKPAQTTTTEGKTPVESKKPEDEKAKSEPSEGEKKATAEAEIKVKEDSTKLAEKRTQEAEKPNERQERINTYIDKSMKRWESKNPEPRDEDDLEHDEWMTNRAYAAEQAEIDGQVHEDLRDWQSKTEKKPDKSDTKKFNEWNKKWEIHRQKLQKGYEKSRTLPKKNEQAQVEASFEGLTKYLTDPKVLEVAKKIRDNDPNSAQLMEDLEKKHKGLGTAIAALIALFVGGLGTTLKN